MFSQNFCENKIDICGCFTVATALEGTDYQIVGGFPENLTFTQENSEHCFVVGIIDDSLVDPNEVITLQFSVMESAGIMVMVENTTEITIQDNDGILFVCSSCKFITLFYTYTQLSRLVSMKLYMSCLRM